MNIEITHKENEHEKHTYTFMLKEVNLVFIKYQIHKKEGRQRKWRLDNIWDNYSMSVSNVTEPNVPESIKREAITQVRSQLNVVRFNEWKAI